jgi:hypothetical protein
VYICEIAYFFIFECAYWPYLSNLNLFWRIPIRVTQRNLLLAPIVFLFVLPEAIPFNIVKTITKFPLNGNNARLIQPAN